MKPSRSPLAGVLLAAAAGVHAGGIPVYDVRTDINFAQSLINAVEQIENQLQQIGQLQQHLAATTGSRGLGALARNSRLDNYVPLDAVGRLENVDGQGYRGLSAPARALRDQGRLYNCAELADLQRTVCEADLARPYEQHALLRQVLGVANGRMAQITVLIDAINGTTDPKSIAELQARLQAENAMLAHEQTRIQALAKLVETGTAIEASRRRERTAASLTTGVRLDSFLGRRDEGVAP